MTLYVDQSFIGQMSYRLPLFRWCSPTLANFRCVICGDSARNEFKRRAYFYKNVSGDGFNFQCHNCGASHSLYTFIDIVFPELLKQYKFESFASSGNKKHTVIEEAIPFKKLEVVFDDVTPVDLLPESHKVVRYLLNERKLPEELLERFLHVEKYVEWLKETTQNPDLHYKEHSRILIPYTTKNDHIYRYVARSYDCDVAAKYLYTDLDLGSSIFNIYHVDPKQQVYVVEGQIDAMILGNQAIALGNAKYDQAGLSEFDDFVIVPDHETRNLNIVSSIEKSINLGMKVCIWPKFYGKDINDMLKNGLSIDSIKDIIQSNSYQGPLAKLKFNAWRRC